MSKKVVLQVRDLFYTHPKTKQRILTNLNLEIYKNEIVCVVGKAGAGKSTLLRHLNGIIKPQSGDVIIQGKSVIENLDFPFHHHVSLLFENPDDIIIFPIVVEDIAFGPRNLKLSQEEVHERVINACKAVRILHLLERETSSLSFGEKTLVTIAGVLAMATDIILFDSPEIGLDLWTKPAILKLFLQLKKKRTLVISTNDLDIIRAADRILLLWDGKIRNEYTSFKEFKKALT